MNIITYLKQPFPKSENRWRTIIQITVFVPIFLLIFQPFGIASIEDSSFKYLYIGGFGLISFITLIFNLIVIENIFSNFFNEKNWRLYKEIFWLFIVISSIGLANVLYTILFSGRDLTLSYIINYQVVTFAVAIFPITIYTILKHNYLQKQHTTSADDVNDILQIRSTPNSENKDICIYSYNEKVKEEFDINNLYYIESRGNDIELHILENNIITSKRIRNTLKRSLEYLENQPKIIQCHRAYIINLNKVDRVEGNSQGLVLKLTNCVDEIPVSRSFVGTIKDRLS